MLTSVRVQEVRTFIEVRALCLGHPKGYGLLNMMIHAALRLAGVPEDKGSAAAAAPSQQPDAAAAATANAAASTSAASASTAAPAGTNKGASVGPEAAAATAATADLPWDSPALDDQQQERLETLLEMVLQHYGPKQGGQLLLQQDRYWHDTALHTCCK